MFVAWFADAKELPVGLFPAVVGFYCLMCWQAVLLCWIKSANIRSEPSLTMQKEKRNCFNRACNWKKTCSWIFHTSRKQDEQKYIKEFSESCKTVSLTARWVMYSGINCRRPAETFWESPQFQKSKAVRSNYWSLDWSLVWRSTQAFASEADIGIIVSAAS